MQRTAVRGFLARFAAPLWPVTIAAAAGGAAIGALAVAPATGATATSMLRVDAPIDVNQIMTGTQPFPDAQPDYLAGEMVYLRSDGFVDAVADSVGSTPDLSVAQNGESNLVSISATADSDEDAVRTVDAAVATYIEHVQEQTRARYLPALDAVNATIPRLEEASRSAAELAMIPYEPSDELVQLYFQRTSLEVQLQRAPGVQVVEPTGLTVSNAALPMSWLGPVGGGLAGALLGLGGALAWRSRSGVLTSPEQLDAGAQPPLRPVIGLGKRRIDAAAARALVAQLPSAHRDRILVVGASAGSGSAVVTRHLAFGVEEHEPVATADLMNDALGDLSSQSWPVATVVDGGSLQDSATVIEAAEHASQIVVVARIGYDVSDDVATLVKAMGNRGVPVTLVCTRAGVFTRLRSGSAQGAPREVAAKRHRVAERR